eukprot:m.308574 g.308574  ORF g.308574 m.308574 type:complete len:336 (+) comp44274_c0_seq1:209-1216(+)
MGCLSSSLKETHGRFSVKNLDDQNRVVGEGELEVTETLLILHSQGAASKPIQWPLKFLRRYGYDENLFSFEAGRRCPTGEGIYAFSTRSAEQIFRLVETNIKRRKSPDADTETGPQGASAPAASAQPGGNDGVDGVDGAEKNPGDSRFLSYAELDLPTVSRAWPIAEKPSADKKKRSGYATIDFTATENAKVDNNKINYAAMDFSAQQVTSNPAPKPAERTNYAQIIPKLRESPEEKRPQATNPSSGGEAPAVRSPLSHPGGGQLVPTQTQTSSSDLHYAHVTVGQPSSEKPLQPKASQSEYTQIDFTKTKALTKASQGEGEYVNTSSSRQTRHH